ncbi:cardiolipin synthase [Porphyromonas crevioricanis]|uniref:Cardiolipin synthase n=1 Tax=Porphyromonas crevioricanis TaxID=393921 RepID=A0AB34PGZ3_9PORP|nr:cardiolipin synthase [Porphyromonas crevioricanis]KGN95004.1 cardiolipin synthetase [Porphyromonas crevioricanis]
MNTILLILYSALVVSLVVVIISENRNPLKATSWLLLITLLPVIGVLLYLLFGQDQRRRRVMSRRVYRRIMRRPQYLSMPEALLSSLQDEQLSPVMRLLVNNSDNPLLAAEHLDIYTEGGTKLEALYQDLETAHDHIHLQYYIISDDEYGIRLQQLLMRKAAEGVRVRVIYDHVGCWATSSKYWKTLREAGVEVYPFMRVAFPIFTGRVNYRNHRKIVVIDGTIGYVGGMNIAKRYVVGNELGMWRDTHIRMEGTAVASLQSSFLIDWYVVSRKVISIEGCYHIPPAPNMLADGIRMQVVAGGPIGRWRTIEQAISYTIARATKYVYIQTPYFLPTDTLNNIVLMAALSGIEVRLMLPKRSDAVLAQYATRSYLSQLMQAGVRVFLYSKGFLHSKLLLVDGRVASVGSANMDFRSLEHNFELNVMIYDETTVERLRKTFEADMESCELLDRQQWAARGRFERFSESFVRLFSPLL